MTRRRKRSEVRSDLPLGSIFLRGRCFGDPSFRMITFCGPLDHEPGSNGYGLSIELPVGFIHTRGGLHVHVIIYSVSPTHARTHTHTH